MAKFRFRAQAALDLRQRQDDEAQRALGAARQARLAAQRGLEAEERRLADAHVRALQDEAQAFDPGRAIWYRNWVKRQRQVIAAAGAAVDARWSEERAVAEQAMLARRKLRALERLKDRSWKAFEVAERRLEQKELDVLGGLRYVAQRPVPEGA